MVKLKVWIGRDAGFRTADGKANQTYLTGFMPRKPRLACPVTSEAYLTRVSRELHISVGAHSCAMNSRLKAAPGINIAEREILKFSCVII
jgi:hypothetical protein